MDIFNLYYKHQETHDTASRKDYIMKNKKFAIIAIVIVSGLLLGGAVSFAAGNISDLEQKWYDFQEAWMNKQVESGRLTQEQADTRLASMEEAMQADEEDALPGFRPNQPNKGQVIQGHFMRNVDIESILGMTHEELRDAYQNEEKRLWDIADELGKTDELAEAILTAAQDGVNQLLENERITQEQADEIMEKVQQAIEDRDDRFFTKPRKGGRGPKEDNDPNV